MFLGLDVLRCLGKPDAFALAAVLRLQYVRLVLLLSSVRQEVAVAARRPATTYRVAQLK